MKGGGDFVRTALLRSMETIQSFAKSAQRTSKRGQNPRLLAKLGRAVRSTEGKRISPSRRCFTSGLPCRHLIFSTHLMANLRKALVIASTVNYR